MLKEKKSFFAALSLDYGLAYKVLCLRKEKTAYNFFVH